MWIVVKLLQGRLQLLPKRLLCLYETSQVDDHSIWRFLTLILVSTFVDYHCAHYIDRSGNIQCEVAARRPQRHAQRQVPVGTKRFDTKLPPSPLVVAWQGPGKHTREHKDRVQYLYKMTWKNPHPEKVVQSLDFITTKTDAAPFLVAITAE